MQTAVGIEIRVGELVIQTKDTVTVATIESSVLSILFSLKHIVVLISARFFKFNNNKMCL